MPGSNKVNSSELTDPGMTTWFVSHIHSSCKVNSDELTDPGMTTWFVSHIHSSCKVNSDELTDPAQVRGIHISNFEPQRR